MTSTNDYSQRVNQLRQLIADADYVLIGAGAGLSAAAGLDYAGEEFRQEFREWIHRYDISNLYSASFYPFETEEESWACWAKHIWFARYRPEALPLYRQLYDVVKEKRYFVITTNVDGQFEKAGFDNDLIFATQGDYAYFQPASGSPKKLYHNLETLFGTDIISPEPFFREHCATCGSRMTCNGCSNCGACETAGQQ